MKLGFFDRRPSGARGDDTGPGGPKSEAARPGEKPGRAVSDEIEMAGPTGLEPATSGVTGLRSNQLNYDPVSKERPQRADAHYTQEPDRRKGGAASGFPNRRHPYGSRLRTDSRC